MQNFLSRLSIKKFQFATLIYIVTYSLAMWSAYSNEVDAIKKSSLNHFGSDITPNLGYFEVLKSAHYELWAAAWSVFILVFIPYLLIAAYFFGFIRLSHG